MIIPAYRGEFGLKIRFHVPIVYGLGGGHVIEIEDGEEALYPRAHDWIVVPRAKDGTRVGRPKTHALGRREERFQPVPYLLQMIQPHDVVLCPRWRTYGASKNWMHWDWLGKQFQEHGHTVFYAGVADASDTSVEGNAAWQYDRPLDATIQMMRQAKLVIAACSGLAHLAVLCGAPLLLFTYRGQVAPGPVINSRGRFVQADYWDVRWKQYYHDANHLKSPIIPVDGWEYPERIVTSALSHLLPTP